MPSSTSFGLALGIAACLLILGFVRYEFSYDSWLPGDAHVFQLQVLLQATAAGRRGMKLQADQLCLRQALKKDFPQIESAAYTSPASSIVHQGRPAIHGRGRPLFTDRALFDVLQMPFVRAIRARARRSPRRGAERGGDQIFGSEDPSARRSR
jgi:putative ABC transport system permease protein